MRQDPPRRLEPVHLGHADVHQEHVGTFPPGELDSLDTVPGFADHFDVAGRSQQHGEAAPNEGLVVGDGDPDHAVTPSPYGSRTATRKPPPVCGPAWNEPP